MSKNVLFGFCMFILLVLASSVFAASATIVNDATAPGPTHSLWIELDAGQNVKNTVENVDSGTYTLSFYYKLKDPGNKFKVSVSGTESAFDSIQLSSTTWSLYTGSVVMAADQQLVQVTFSSEAGADFWIDELQFVRAPEFTKFNNFDYDIGCCPFDYCWTGGNLEGHPSCVHSKYYERNVSMPPLGINLADFGAIPGKPSSFFDVPSGFRCINGSWKFSRIKYTPLYDGAGFCSDESQCFIGGDIDAAIACVPNESIRGYDPQSTGEESNFFCFNGNWTTRTKEIALQLLGMAAQTDTYTIFCDSVERSLNPANGFAYTDYLGENVASLLMPKFVEEFCVMELNGQVIAGVALVNEINETASGSDDCKKDAYTCIITPESCDADGCILSGTSAVVKKSFVEMLKGSDQKNYCDGAVANRDGKYHECINQDVYYNSKFKTVIFTKPMPTPQVVPFKTTDKLTLFENIFSALKNLLGKMLNILGISASPAQFAQSTEQDFIKNAGSFDKLYISHYPSTSVFGKDREIKAIRETRAHRIKGANPEYKTFINAEYLNYQLDACNFFYRHNYGEVRNQISSLPIIRCTPVILENDDWIYSVYVESPLFGTLPVASGLDSVKIWEGGQDTFWNDITARVRTQVAKKQNDTKPSAPSFETLPETPVVGTEVNFSLTSKPKVGEQFIAITWDFNDSGKTSSQYNISTIHIFKESRNYDVTLCVMNQNFKVECTTRTIFVGFAPSASIDEYDQTSADKESGGVRVNFSIVGGHKDYTFEVRWGDGLYDSITSNVEASGNFTYSSVAESAWNLTAGHEYDMDIGSTIEVQINVSGTDRDGVGYFQTNNITLEKIAVPST